MATSLKNDSKNLKQARDEDSLISALQLVSSTIVPMALQAAIELGVFDAMARAGEGAKLSAADIAAMVSCKNPEASTMLDRVLRLLASHSVIHCSVVDDPQGSKQGMYSLSPVSRCFVTDTDGASLGPVLALLHDKVFMESWRELKGAIKEGGIAFNRVHGMHAFEYLSMDPRFNDVFNRAMHNSTIISMKNILEMYNGFEEFNKIVDVGGGLGVNLSLIASKYPHVRGINFDLPHVIQHAPDYPGVQHVEGDMFQSVPKGDAIFMKWILHDWSDEHCVKLLKNCHKAIPENGKVIIVDAVLPTESETSSVVKNTLQRDVLMMTQTLGGKERTQQEFMDLASLSGFTGIRLVCHVCGLWVIEFHK